MLNEFEVSHETLCVGFGTYNQTIAQEMLNKIQEDCPGDWKLTECPSKYDTTVWYDISAWFPKEQANDALLKANLVMSEYNLKDE